MSPKFRLTLLLTLILLLLALLMNSHSFSTPHRRNAQPATLMTVIMLAGVVSGVILLIVLYLYFHDAFGSGRYGAPPGKSLKAYIIAVILTSLVMMLLFKVISETSINPVNATNRTACLRVNGTVINCTPAQLNPLLTTNGTAPLRTSKAAVFTHLYLIFLLPILGAFLYLGFYYYRLGRMERERRRKVEKAMEFDRKLDEVGLDVFSNPREAVVGIYKNAVLWLEGLGIPYRESWTHWEHAEHVRYMHEAFVELTKLFEKAKYAPERVEWADAEKALAIYNGLRGKAHEVIGNA
ncbi:DUF4129 domain-containing protein [Thermococcus sp.]|uniref:DUF4129 domain-containing protein n=1 Tax=Thermococcus sp. TaxID=35749 RepID=UPI0026112338|nr:DUF4129 domain-containing protein [Thermococcus sp.]